MVLVHNLAGARQPIVQVGLVGLILIGLCRAIKTRIARIVDVGVEGPAAVVEPPVLGAVRGRAEMQSLFAHRHGEFAHHVALRAHFRGAPFRQIGGVHGEAIVMLRHRHDVLRS